MLWTGERITALLNERCEDWHTTVKIFLAAEWLENMRDEYEARIAELKSKLAACIELDEAKLRQVDSQVERIAELEAALIAAKTQLAASEMWK